MADGALKITRNPGGNEVVTLGDVGRWMTEINRTSIATEHVHGCLNCRPDMVPDFDPSDPRYHAYSGTPQVCTSTFSVLVDGQPVGYTKGAFEGPEGWALVAGATTDDVHECPTCTVYGEHDGIRTTEHLETCVVPRFGRVEVIHDGGCRV